MKKLLLLAATAMGTTMPLAAHAQGIPVHDNASTLQLIMQVKNTLQQVHQGEQMIAQATSTFNSLSKITQTANFASVLNDANINQILPSQVQDVASLARADYNQLGNFGSAAQSLSGDYKFSLNLGGGRTLDEGVASAYNRYLSSINQGPSVAAMLGLNVSNQARQVDGGLDELRTAISSAKDPKDAMDLNARATIENAKISNRLLQMMAMQQYYNASERMRYNAYRASNSAAAIAADNARLQANAAQAPGY